MRPGLVRLRERVRPVPVSGRVPGSDPGLAAPRAQAAAVVRPEAQGGHDELPALPEVVAVTVHLNRLQVGLRVRPQLHQDDGDRAQAAAEELHQPCAARAAAEALRRQRQTGRHGQSVGQGRVAGRQDHPARVGCDLRP